MTRGENTVIEKLRDELHAYHVEVQRLVQRCDACRGDVLQISADVYGLPGKKETSPGLMGEVAELRRSRKLILVAPAGRLGAADDPARRRDDGDLAGSSVNGQKGTEEVVGTIPARRKTLRRQPPPSPSPSDP